MTFKKMMPKGCLRFEMLAAVEVRKRNEINTRSIMFKIFSEFKVNLSGFLVGTWNVFEMDYPLEEIITC